MPPNPFEALGLPKRPIFLAPLAGVSDHPFRRMCQYYGADLTYVEMISATALLHDSARTLEMLRRHPDEPLLGVQVTARSAEEMGAAVEKLNGFPFETIDINMGCPVRKVVRSGCGSAILRDPDRVFATTKAAVDATDRPVSVKIRLGWDHEHRNYLEVADAATRAGASWLTVHGRTRSDNYSKPVDLEAIATLKNQLSVPVVGNGNLMCPEDVSMMERACGVDGFMVSRGALGNPWIFAQIKGAMDRVSVAEWTTGVTRHLQWQKDAYGEDSAMGLVCMRKHLLWYAKGWPGSKILRDSVNRETCWRRAREYVGSFAEQLTVPARSLAIASEDVTGRFTWDPKFDMDRQLDRGVGEDGLH